MEERRGEMWGSKMVGVLGPLVLGEQNPRTPGTKIQNQLGEAGLFLSGEKELGFRVFVFFLNVSKLTSPLLQVLETSIYRQKMLPSFSTWSLNFFLFVNFDFSYFFVFFENEQINVDSTRKINDFKNDA